MRPRLIAGYCVAMFGAPTPLDEPNRIGRAVFKWAEKRVSSFLLMASPNVTNSSHLDRMTAP